MWPVQPGEGHGQFGLPDWTIARGLTVSRDGDGWEVLRLLGETLERFEREAGEEAVFMLTTGGKQGKDLL